jgi:hypothetical protein
MIKAGLGCELSSAIREKLEGSLLLFARMFGDINDDWDEYEEMLVRLSEDGGVASSEVAHLSKHIKEHCISILCAWLIAKNFWVSISFLCLSVEDAEFCNLRVKQIVGSGKFKELWGMGIKESGGSWLSVSHGLRDGLNIGDRVFTATPLSRSPIGLSPTTLVIDDIYHGKQPEDFRRRMALHYSTLVKCGSCYGFVESKITKA